MLTVNVERPFLRWREVKRYYEESKGMTLSAALHEVESWFKESGFKFGRGANHVWLADQAGNRLMIITEEGG